MGDAKHVQLFHDLVRRRRELMLGIGAMEADLAAVDRVLRMFHPDVEPSDIPALVYRKPADCAKRGEVTRLILDTLRNEGQALSVTDLTRLAMAARSIGSEHYTRHSKSMRKALAKLEMRGFVSAEWRDGRRWWRIICADRCAASPMPSV